MTSDQAPFFVNRWRIRGIITTTSPLVVGSGGTTTRPGLVDEYPDGERVKINAVATDHRSRAYLPGTTIKGCLRAWLPSRPRLAADVERVFGSPDPKKKDARGGCAEFWDACAADLHLSPDPVPYWSDERWTGVGSSVAIDRRRRTASAKKLLHFEYVPAGVSFHVSITGQDLSTGDVALLLLALDAINQAGAEAVLFGAETANGFGRCAWTLSGIERITSAPDEIRRWLQAPHVGYEGLPSVPGEVRAEIDRAKAALVTPLAPRAAIEIGLRLRFQGPFLVNDPSRTRKKGEDDEDDDDIDPALRAPDHAPLLDGNGGPLLPARSLRGALRSQAERILRTIAADPRIACRPTSTREACPAIGEAHERSTLCLACQVFGAPGWAAPVEVSAFTREDCSALRDLRQEFVAIDRFTGGGARGLKFNAMSFDRPVLQGRLVVDLARIETWGLGLLLLALRDLVEGDVPLGFGQAKGYGAVLADVTQLSARNVAARLGPPLQACGLATPATEMVVADPLQATTPEIEALLARFVNDLHARIARAVQPVAAGGKPA